ncbi:TPA: hypothetical protein ACHJVB_004888, partial [Escherichia coli]
IIQAGINLFEQNLEQRDAETGYADSPQNIVYCCPYCPGCLPSSTPVYSPVKIFCFANRVYR